MPTEGQELMRKGWEGGREGGREERGEEEGMGVEKKGKNRNGSKDERKKKERDE